MKGISTIAEWSMAEGGVEECSYESQCKDKGTKWWVWGQRGIRAAKGHEGD